MVLLMVLRITGYLKAVTDPIPRIWIRAVTGKVIALISSMK